LAFIASNHRFTNMRERRLFNKQEIANMFDAKRTLQLGASAALLLSGAFVARNAFALCSSSCPAGSSMSVSPVQTTAWGKVNNLPLYGVELFSANSPGTIYISMYQSAFTLGKPVTYQCADGWAQGGNVQLVFLEANYVGASSSAPVPFAPNASLNLIAEACE
jgi:hypothetical protein